MFRDTHQLVKHVKWCLGNLSKRSIDTGLEGRVADLKNKFTLFLDEVSKCVSLDKGTLDAFDIFMEEYRDLLVKVHEKKERMDNK